MFCRGSELVVKPSAFDDTVVDSRPPRIGILMSVASDEFLITAHRFVRDMLTLRRPDGSTPEAAMIQEVLRSVLDAVGPRLTRENGRGPGPPTHRAWITAWRECSHDLALLQRMLA